MTSTPRTRGQLLLTSAVVIAVILLGIVAVLNGGIFAQNGGERGALSESGAARSVVDTVSTDGPGLLTDSASATLNRSGSSAEQSVFVAHSNLVSNTSDYSALLRRAIGSARSAAVAVTLVSTTNGTGGYLVDDDSGMSIPSGTLVTNANRIGDFHVRLQSMTVGETFTVTVTDSSTWKLIVTKRPSGRVHVVTSGGPKNADCTVSDSLNGIAVNISAGIVDRGPSTCNFSPPTTAIASPYTVSFANPSGVSGTFTLAASNGVSSGTFNTVGNSPYRVPNLTSATYRVQYDSPHASYNTSVTVQPRRTGPTGVQSPPRSELVYAVQQGGTNWLYSMDSNGIPTNYSIPNVTAIGPKQVDLNENGGLGVPYVNRTHHLAVVDQYGPRALASQAESDPIAIGRWRGFTSVFYVNRSNGDIYRATPGLHPTPVRVDGGPLTASAVLGMGDLGAADSTPDLVYRDTSGVVKYVDGNATYDLHSNAVGAGGAPRSFAGKPAVPVADSGQIEVYTVSSTLYSKSVGASSSSVTGFNWTADGRTDVVYANGSGTLAYVNSTSSGGKAVVTVNGNTVTVNRTVGVA